MDSYDSLFHMWKSLLAFVCNDIPQVCHTFGKELSSTAIEDKVEGG